MAKASDTSSLQKKKGKTNPYSGQHPMNNPANEERLLRHVKDRLDNAKPSRDDLCDRLADIDVQMSGFVKLEGDDRKRDRDNKKGKSPKPVSHNLPMAAAQIDEVQTYLLSVYAPEGDLFEAVAPPEQQELAKGLTTFINQQGVRVAYYDELGKWLTNALKYNISAMGVTWERQRGIVYKNDEAGQPVKTTDVVWEGNVLKNFDMYNFICDPTVHPTKLSRQGEFYAYVEVYTPFTVRKMEADEQIFDVDKYVSNVEGGCRYYKSHPQIRNPSDRGSENGSTNWKSTLTGGAVQDATPGIELVYYVGWITPKDFGLSSSNDLELWLVVMANDLHITRTQRLEDSAGLLPIGCACPIVDDLDNDQRTYAEQLLPLQSFASFLLNSHQEATRKALYGLKFYNRNIFPDMDKAQIDLVSGWVPMKSTSQAQDIDKAVRSFNDVPATENNVADIARIDALMQKVLPSDMLGQVADLDRATLYQAAATVQAGNRRSLKIARVIMSQALEIIKVLMIYNIYASQQPVRVQMEDGSFVNIDPAQVRESKVELQMAGGIKGIDKLMVAEVWKGIITMVLQSQQAMAEIDVVALLDYYTSLVGDKTSLASFRRKTPAPAMPGTAPDGASPVTPGAGEQAPMPQGAA